MDVLISARSSARLLLITCIFIYSGSTRDNVQEQKFHTLRSKRASDGKNCIRNDTEVFPGIDCNVDKKYPCLKKICGRLDLLQSKASMWECVKYDRSRSGRLGCFLDFMRGYWMVSKCPSYWPLNELKSKCENTPSNFPHPVREDNIPVVGENGLTYRNKYCAFCHGVENFTAWRVLVETRFQPTGGYDLDSQIKNNSFLAIVVVPKPNQPRRTCLGRNYVHHCSISTTKFIYNKCTKGRVKFVRSRYSFFKNKACARCNGVLSFSPLRRPKPCIVFRFRPYSLVFKLRKVSALRKASTVVAQSCPPGTVYDRTLKICRNKLMIPSSRKLTNEYLFLLWLKKTTYVKRYFKLALISEFSLTPYQVSNIAFHNQGTMNNECIVATFHLTLTPFQNLMMDNKRNALLNVTDDETAFLKLFNYSGNFTLRWENKSFAVVKMASKQLSCYGEVKFQSDEYEMNESNTSFVVIKTGKVFSLRDYTLVKENKGNITLCRKLVVPDCTEGAFVPLKRNEYMVFPNLSVYHNATQNMFNFGEYLISIKKKNCDISNTTQNYLSNISVCLSFNNTYNGTVKKNSTAKTSYGLKILTLIGFIVSIICLILLLITYGLFRELRTVPGMNLMNLSVSMLLSNLIWLIGTSHFTETTACKVFAILEHYLLQVSFLAMSVISYHSLRVFSQPIVGRHSNTSSSRFVKYSVVVWLSPSIFVAICVVLDETEVFPVDYGTNCWLGTVNSILYLFLLPLAISLLYNIYTFVKIARLLLRHDETRDILQRKEGKQNLLICIKLASLVGFPWLFAFLGVLFPDEIAFEYLFVILVCLQGLYIGMAFLFNKKTLGLYRNRKNRVNIPRTH